MINLSYFQPVAISTFSDHRQLPPDVGDILIGVVQLLPKVVQLFVLLVRVLVLILTGERGLMERADKLDS